MEREIDVRPQVDIACQLGFGQAPPMLFVDDIELEVDSDGYQLLTVGVRASADGCPEPQVRLVAYNAVGTGYRVHAWTLLSSEQSEAWDHHQHEYCHRTFGTSDVAVRVQVALLKAEDPIPMGPPAPGTSSTLMKIKVRKKGGMPIDEGGG